VEWRISAEESAFIRTEVRDVKGATWQLSATRSSWPEPLKVLALRRAVCDATAPSRAALGKRSVRSYGDGMSRDGAPRLRLVVVTPLHPYAACGPSRAKATKS
jgi:hypothetical protein